MAFQWRSQMFISFPHSFAEDTEMLIKPLESAVKLVTITTTMTIGLVGDLEM